MKAIADTLQVARSNLVERAKRGGSRPRPPYRKAGDAELLARIRRLVDVRPSYGYRRITALLNRQAEAEGLACLPRDEADGPAAGAPSRAWPPAAPCR